MEIQWENSGWTNWRNGRYRLTCRCSASHSGPVGEGLGGDTVGEEAVGLIGDTGETEDKG